MAMSKVWEGEGIERVSITVAVERRGEEKAFFARRNSMADRARARRRGFARRNEGGTSRDL